MVGKIKRDPIKKTFVYRATHLNMELLEQTTPLINHILGHDEMLTSI